MRFEIIIHKICIAVFVADDDFKLNTTSMNEQIPILKVVLQ